MKFSEKANEPIPRRDRYINPLPPQDPNQAIAATVGEAQLPEGARRRDPPLESRGRPSGGLRWERGKKSSKIQIANQTRPFKVSNGPSTTKKQVHL